MDAGTHDAGGVAMAAARLSSRTPPSVAIVWYRFDRFCDPHHLVRCYVSGDGIVD